MNSSVLKFAEFFIPKSDHSDVASGFFEFKKFWSSNLGKDTTKNILTPFLWTDYPDERELLKNVINNVIRVLSYFKFSCKLKKKKPVNSLNTLSMQSCVVYKIRMPTGLHKEVLVILTHLPANSLQQKPESVSPVRKLARNIRAIFSWLAATKKNPMSCSPGRLASALSEYSMVSICYTQGQKELPPGFQKLLTTVRIITYKLRRKILWMNELTYGHTVISRFFNGYMHF